MMIIGLLYRSYILTINFQHEISEMYHLCHHSLISANVLDEFGIGLVIRIMVDYCEVFAI